jgi:signal transduction histidine kinase
LKDFWRNIESYKVYNLIAIVTIFFIVLSINSFYYVSAQIKSLAEQNRDLIIKDIQHTTAIWLLERVTSIENNVKILDNVFDNEQTMHRFASIISKGKTEFDAIHILIPDKYFYVNDKKMDDYENNYTYEGGQKRFFKNGEERWYERANWFIEVKENMRTTIERAQTYQLFGESTINICAPVSRNNIFEGVFCGIIRANSLLEKIEDIELPTGGYYFISDKRGDILTSFGNVSLSGEDIKRILNAEFLESDDEIKDLYVDNDIITTYKFKDFDWYISVGINESEIKNDKTIQAFFKRNIILILFILFMIGVNVMYIFLNAKAAAKKREYEYILAYNSRMSEVGELVSGINHQLRQPLNSLSLIISGALELLSNKALDVKAVVSSLSLSKCSIDLMNKTIDIFRNFYRYNDAISEFYLKDAVEHVLYVMDTNLSQNNITMEVDDNNIQELKVVSIENFIQQILLVLIQNAGDAIGPMKNIKEINKRKIMIRFEVDEKNAHMYVSDFGVGVKKTSEESIFSIMHKSQKKKGFGMGLFFAKKLANERLSGDVSLASNANPTTFKFTIKKNIKDV